MQTQGALNETYGTRKAQVADIDREGKTDLTGFRDRLVNKALVGNGNISGPIALMAIMIGAAQDQGDLVALMVVAWASRARNDPQKLDMDTVSSRLGKGEALKASATKFPTAMFQRIERGVAYRCGQAQNFGEALTCGLCCKGGAMVGLIEPSNLSHDPIKPFGADLNGHFLFQQRAADEVCLTGGQVIFSKDRLVPHEGRRVEQQP
jgi:hypothetical protein